MRKLDATRGKPERAKAALLKPLRPAPNVIVSHGVVRGSFFPVAAMPLRVAVTVDGRFIGSGPVSAGQDNSAACFSVLIPDSVLGVLLDVLDIRTGASVLGHPISLLSHRGLHWKGWSATEGRITGEFAVGGPAVPTGEDPIPVELLSDNQTYGYAFAEPGPDTEAGRLYQFSCNIPTLPHLHRPLSILPRIGNFTLPVPALVIGNDEAGLVGYVDEQKGSKVYGWVTRPRHPEDPVTVELRVNGQPVARTIANRYRADIEAMGFAKGLAAFVLSGPKNLPRDMFVSVVIADTDTNLTNSPFSRPVSPPLVGYFDAVEGPFAGGWLVNMHDPNKPLQVEALCDGDVIGSGLANLYRSDVENAGLPTARCGFRLLLDRPLVKLFDRDIIVRVCGTNYVLPGSPRQVSQNENITRFLSRNTRIPLAAHRRLSQRLTYQTRHTGISLIMPVFNTTREWLLEALNSVLGQWDANWELICVDDGSTTLHVKEILDAASLHDKRIRILRSPNNVGIARAVNFGLRAARGTYVAFVDHDDVVEPDAVHKLAMAAQATKADLIYSDEAITTDDINSIVEVRARPTFSYDYYLSHPYFVHLVCVRTSLARQVGGWDESLAISADVDFVLRVLEVAVTVTHVPRVLYRWRTHGSSTGHQKQAEVSTATKGALTRHLARRDLPAIVSDGLRYNEYRLDWPDDGGEVLVVIPTKNRVDLLRACIDSIERTSAGANIRIVVIDHASNELTTIRYLKTLAKRHSIMPYHGSFNYALMNNLAVRIHGKSAKYVLFLNNDVEATKAGWIPRLRSLASRAEVGAVGPLLLYGDDRVQHAGVLVGFSGAADHAMKFVNAYLSKGNRHPGYNCNLTTVRDYSAVTAACMMMRLDVFRAVNGFDESFVVGFNDTDLCLRIGEAGFKVLYDGFTVLYHHESATRTENKEVDHPEDDARLRTRWQQFFKVGDPYYSPLLASKGTDHTLRQDPGCRGSVQLRTVSLLPGKTAASVAAPHGVPK